MVSYTRRPQWLKLTPFQPNDLQSMRKLTTSLKLHTVCESARCPNRPECYAAGTATFLLLGNICTRNCAFCAVRHGKPRKPDPEEPEHVIQAIDRLQLRYVVLTSVTRDDLPDGGAMQFARTVKAIHAYNSDIKVEMLIPDFQGSLPALQSIINSSPHVINHNLETVPRLYLEVRPQAKYERSLKVLEQTKRNNTIVTKSGLILGMGETRKEIIQAMKDLREVGCQILTLGQYLQPSVKHFPVLRYVHPIEFHEYKRIGQELGFQAIIAGPLVRSSYHAAEIFHTTVKDMDSVCKSSGKMGQLEDIT